jgi:hypothetical protein
MHTHENVRARILSFSLSLSVLYVPEEDSTFEGEVVEDSELEVPEVEETEPEEVEETEPE